MSSSFSIYLLPPVLSLIFSVYLAFLVMARGKMKAEKILFALVCIWNSLLNPLFISHHFISNQETILSLERSVHFFYVYLPVIQILFYHHILNIHRNWVIWSMLVTSFAISLTTQSPLYISGLNSFSWGYIARGGPTFQLFGLYGAIAFIYCIYCFLVRLRVESNIYLQLKFKYLLPIGDGRDQIIASHSRFAWNTGSDYYNI